MIVQIIGVAQDMSLETGLTDNYITFMLPDGQRVRALVDDDDAKTIVGIFVQSGSAAAQTALAQASGEQVRRAPPQRNEYERMQTPAEVETQPRPYAPLETDNGDGDFVSTFGGDFDPTDPQLAAVGESLRRAEDKLSHAIGDTSTLSPSELRQVAARISAPEQVMPVPNILTPPSGQKRRAPVVQADVMGNPILQGAGLVDPVSLMGGNTEGEEDAGQV